MRSCEATPSGYDYRPDSGNERDVTYAVAHYCTVEGELLSLYPVFENAKLPHVQHPGRRHPVYMTFFFNTRQNRRTCAISGRRE